MASAKVLLYKSKKKVDGRHPVAIRVIKDRKVKYFYIDWIYEKDWNENTQRVRHTHPNSSRLNNLIVKRLSEVDDLILESESLHMDYSAGQITKIIKGNRKRLTFFKLAGEFIEDLHKSGKHNRASADSGRINVFRAFLGGEDIFFHEVDDALLRKLKVYLVGKRDASERTVMNYYVVIRTLFNLAISQGIVEAKFYPFGKGKIRIKFPQTLKIGLEEHEIKQIAALDLDTGTTIWHTRNVFFFSFYLAGVRISDVLRMRWSDIKGDRLYYKMGKNNKIDSLKIPDKVIAIISHYKPDQKGANDFIFPELKKADWDSEKDVHAKIRTATKKFNKYLTVIALKADIDKKLTTHISRHSFGNIAGDKVSPHMLQKLYRHTSLTTTLGYQGNFVHKDADDALDTILGF